MKESKVVPQIIEATGGKHIMFSSKWYTYSIYYTPSVKYPEVYVHPCTKSTGLHEIPRCARHQGWSSRFLVTIGQGDSGILFVAFPGIHLGWCMVVPKMFNGNVCLFLLKSV